MKKNSTLIGAFKGFKFEQLTGIGAFFVGIAALAIAWQEAQIMRRQQHAQVLPILTADRAFAEDDNGALQYSVTLVNRGVGPALVRQVGIFDASGKPVTLRQLADAAIAIGGEPDISMGRQRGAIAPQEELMLASFNWASPSEAVTFDGLVEEFNRNEYEVCYCSVFEECWTVRNTQEPVPADTCKASN